MNVNALILKVLVSSTIEDTPPHPWIHSSQHPSTSTLLSTRAEPRRWLRCSACISVCCHICSPTGLYASCIFHPIPLSLCLRRDPTCVVIGIFAFCTETGMIIALDKKRKVLECKALRNCWARHAGCATSGLFLLCLSQVAIMSKWMNFRGAWVERKLTFQGASRVLRAS